MLNLLLFVAIYVLVRLNWNKIQSRVEKLEEYNGEFIYTFFNKFWKKEMYFSLNEIEEILFTRMVINKNKFDKLSIKIFLKDQYVINLNKKESCVKLLKSCRENNKDLYEKVFKRVPMGIDIYSIVEEEIDNFVQKAGELNG